MFAPQKKGTFPSLTTIRGEQGVPAFLSILKSGRGVIHDKDRGKAVVYEEPYLNQKYVTSYDGMNGNALERGQREVSKSFEKDCFLDENVAEISDREALVRRISELEKELSEYQYHMGLLLIEKKEWASKYEKLRQELVDAMESQKRMQKSYTNTVNKLNIQEQILRKSLDLQKQSNDNLVKALNEMHAKNAEVKLRYNNKLAEVLDMEAVVQEKELEVRGKLHSLDAKLAEASSRASEINRRLEDTEADEYRIHKSPSSSIIEKSNHEKDLAQQRKDFQHQEQELLEHQRRLVRRQIILDDWEADANIKENIQKKEVPNLEETWKSWKMANGMLELRESNVDMRLKALDDKQKRLIGDECSILKCQEEESELEIELKRRKIGEGFGEKLNDLAHEETKTERMEVEISRKEHPEEMEVVRENCENERSRNSLEDTFTEENENLRNEKEKLENEHRLLDEKRSKLEADLKQLTEEKERFEKWRCAEEDRLSKERLAVMTSQVNMVEDNGLGNCNIAGSSNGSTILKSNVPKDNSRTGEQHRLHENATEISQGLDGQLVNSGSDSLTNQEQLPKTCRSSGFTVTGSTPDVVLSYRRNKVGTSSIMSDKSTELSPQRADPSSVILGGRVPRIKKIARSLSFGSDRVTHQPSELDTCKTFSDVDPNVEPLGSKGNVKSQCMLLVPDDSSNVSDNGVQCNIKSKCTNKIDHHVGLMSPDSDSYSYLSRPNADDGPMKSKWSSLHLPNQQNDMQEIGTEIQLSKKRHHKIRSTNVFVKKSRSINALVQNTKDMLEESSQKEDSEVLIRSAEDVNPEDFTSRSGSQKMPISHVSVKIAVELHEENAEANTGKAEGHGASTRTQEGGEELEVSPGTDVPGSRQYNFRRSTLVQSGAVAQKLADRTMRKKKGKPAGA